MMIAMSDFFNGLFCPEKIFSKPIKNCAQKMMAVTGEFKKRVRSVQAWQPQICNPVLHAIWDCVDKIFSYPVTRENLEKGNCTVDLGMLGPVMRAFDDFQLPTFQLLPPYYDIEEDSKPAARDDHKRQQEAPKEKQERQSKRQRGGKEKGERQEIKTISMPADVQEAYGAVCEKNIWSDSMDRGQSNEGLKLAR